MAEIISFITDKDSKVIAVNKACDLFKKENPLFDCKRFVKACGL